MTLAREIAVFAGLAIAISGVACYSWRLAIITCGLTIAASGLIGIWNAVTIPWDK